MHFLEHAVGWLKQLFLRRQAGASNPAGASDEEILNSVPEKYWRKPLTQVESPHFWTDRDPEKQGMLSFDQIRRYAIDLRMIYPFDEDGLKPASYDLTLGPLYQLNGKDHVLKVTQPTLEIPPNSIVFVAMREQLILPYYVIGRFDLQINLIYQGLLLGTGPQVDPGFRGVLSCPLHNISDNPIRIKLGDPLAKIDFEKTGGFPQGAIRFLAQARVSSDEALYAHQVQLRRDFGVVLFNKTKRWRRPITDYEPGRLRVSSSIASVEKTVAFLRGVAFLAGLAAFVAIAGLFFAGESLVAGSTTAAEGAARAATQAEALNANLQVQVSVLSTQVAQLDREHIDLLHQVQQLQSPVNPTATPGPG